MEAWVEERERGRISGGVWVEGAGRCETQEECARDETGYDMEIKGAVALVTGGASGLGGASASLLAARGAKVVIADIRPDTGEVKAKELGESGLFVQTDMTDPVQVQHAVDVASELGPLRIVLNAAGTGSASRTVNRRGEPHSADMFDFVVNVNLRGTFYGLTLGAAAIAKTDPLGEDGARGVVINTASVAAFDGQIGQLAYSATKGAVVAMALPAARDLAVLGIRVNTIAPGTFDTPLMSLMPQAKKDELALNIPFPKRLGHAEEYAMLVESIVGNSYINGECIRLDGAIRMPPK